jgi:hypothetical protein
MLSGTTLSGYADSGGAFEHCFGAVLRAVRTDA